MSIAEKLTTIAENEQKVYDAGKKAEYDRFWNAFQDNGDRTNYDYMCRFVSATDFFYPKYDIKPTSGLYMFGLDTKGFDLAARLEECGVTLDVSNATALAYMFYFSEVSRVPEMNIANYGGRARVFSRDTVTVDKLTVKHGFDWTNVFSANSYLQNITFGEITSSIDLKNCPLLTHESLINLIENLKDYSSDTSGTDYAVTIGQSNVEKLTAEELLIIENKGWSYG